MSRYGGRRRDRIAWPTVRAAQESGYQADAGFVDDDEVKKSFLAASGGILALAGAVLYFVALPAWQEQRNDQWQKAGERALNRVVLPGSFHPFKVSKSGYLTVSCGPRQVQQCFVAEGDPRSNVTALRTAVTSVLRGTFGATCHKESLSTIPDRCSLQVPVAGSRLVVLLFARPVSGGRPLSHFSGTYVQVLVDSRQ